MYHKCGFLTNSNMIVLFKENAKMYNYASTQYLYKAIVSLSHID